MSLIRLQWVFVTPLEEKIIVRYLFFQSFDKGSASLNTTNCDASSFSSLRGSTASGCSGISFRSIALSFSDASAYKSSSIAESAEC